MGLCSQSGRAIFEWEGATVADARKKKSSKPKQAECFTVQDAVIRYSGAVVSKRGKPVKIAADFDTTMAALLAVPPVRKKRKR